MKKFGRLVRTDFEKLIERESIENAILRLTIIGQYEHRWELVRDIDIWEETISEIATQTGKLWVEELTLNLSDLELDIKGATAVEELGQIMHQIASEESFISRKC